MDPWRIEIRELHDFIEGWFLGTVRSMQRMRDALADGFTIVGPDGSVSDRATTLLAVERGRAQAASLRITIHDDVLLDASDDRITARYVESHDLADRSSHRWSTVVFAVDTDGPNGLRWLTVHETWITDLP